MYTCPKKDIHSIYLDNELPEPYRSQYLHHLADCPECQKKLNKLKSLKEIMRQDSDEKLFSQDQLDESYKRLQAQLSYSKITVPETKRRVSSGKTRSAISWMVTGMAAAAAVAFVIPQGSTKSPIQAIDFQPAARTATIAPTPSMISMNDIISPASLSTLFGQSETPVQTASFGITPIASSVQDPYAAYDFTSYDIFTSYPTEYHTVSMDSFTNDIFEAIYLLEQKFQEPVYGISFSLSEKSLSDYLLNLNSSYNYNSENYFSDYLTGN